ncbi:hypothetical protein DFP73DRAFT_538748 [Morchella snyderi]|nr:hypothetical protein DFP73DRAFT_538748 [Morchella snyderi]
MIPACGGGFFLEGGWGTLDTGYYYYYYHYSFYSFYFYFYYFYYFILNSQLASYVVAWYMVHVVLLLLYYMY